MAVLIEGMEMPKHDDEYVIFTVYGDGGVVYGPLNRPHVRYKHRAVSVPEPHGRLGDLDRLEQMFADIDNAPYSGFDGEEPFYSAEDAAQIIRLSPTIIPAEPAEGGEA